MCNPETEELLEFFNELDAPPPPTLIEDIAALTEGRRVAEQAAADNAGQPERKIRDAMSMALYRHWMSVPW